MRLSCDRTGFPVIHLDGSPLAASLLPVCKVQAERFFAEPNEYGDEWYKAVLAVNPRSSWRSDHLDSIEGLFLTGILHAEASAYARWTGEAWDIPTDSEWRRLYGELAARPFDATGEQELTRCPMADCARSIVSQVLRHRQVKTWRNLCLLADGVFELVRHRDSFGNLGRPHRRTLNHTFDPLSDNPLTPSLNERRPLAGFRLVGRSQRGTEGK